MVSLLYKKGDPREIRNYRPITLLNVDYKIMAHILVARLKVVIDDIVSNQASCLAARYTSQPSS